MYYNRKEIHHFHFNDVLGFNENIHFLHQQHSFIEFTHIFKVKEPGPKSNNNKEDLKQMFETLPGLLLEPIL
jgi:hypothetical protein